MPGSAGRRAQRQWRRGRQKYASPYPVVLQNLSPNIARCKRKLNTIREGARVVPSVGGEVHVSSQPTNGTRVPPKRADSHTSRRSSGAARRVPTRNLAARRVPIRNGPDGTVQHAAKQWEHCSNRPGIGARRSIRLRTSPPPPPSPTPLFHTLLPLFVGYPKLGILIIIRAGVSRAGART